ncbi:MAG: hypothetical protein WCL56_13235 [Sediminibacterium sp.]|jgi:hypothetical protein
MKKIHNELQEKYKQNFLKVRELVNEFDPLGLIKSGSPKNEYDCLTEKLISAVYNQRTTDEILNLLVHELEDHFGLDELDSITEPYRSTFFRSADTMIKGLNNLILPD